MPGLTGLELAAGAAPLPDAAAGRLRDRPRASTPSRPSTSSRRLRAQAGARGPAGRGGTPGGRGRRAAAPADAGRRDPGRARRGDPLRRPRRHHATSRRTATTRGCTPAGDSYLIRIPLSTLEEEWAPAGFVRIHRSLLVALAHVDEVRIEAGRCTVLVGGAELGVSRRHTRELRDLLLIRGGRSAVSEQRPQRVRVTGPPRVRAPVRAAGAGDDRRADPARRGLPRLAAARAAAAGDPGARADRLTRRAAAARLPPVCRASPTSTWSGCRCPGCCWRSWSTRSCCSLGWRYVRSAERNERDFADLVEATSVSARRRTRHRRGRSLVTVATLAIGTLGLRFSRTTSDFFVASRTVQPAAQRLGHRRRVPLRGVASSASPGWCWRSAPTCSGTRSAGPPATSCCWCWSPRRCAARAPTRCPTSPRPGWRRGRCARSCSVLVVGDRLALPAAAVPGRRPDPRAPPSARPRWVGPGSSSARRARQRRRPAGCAAITFVQAFQYWLKLTALLVPAMVLLVVWAGDGPPAGERRGRRRGRCRWPAAGRIGLYTTYSLMHRDCSSAPWGCRTSSCASTPTPTAGPPGVRRWSCSPCSALFYLLPPVYGALGRIYARRPGRRRDAPTPWCSSCRG